jgi:hypothetical protein
MIEVLNNFLSEAEEKLEAFKLELNDKVLDYFSETVESILFKDDDEILS